MNPIIAKAQVKPHILFVVTFVSIVAAIMSGCGPKVDIVETGPLSEDPETAMRRINADPVHFFQQTLARTRRVKTLRMKFQRQERLGVFGELRPIEHITAEYRDDPFSVHFTWTDQASDYLQCVYIEGENDNRVALLPRKGPFGLPPRVGNYDPQLGVTFAKTRNPITDFGPRRLMERTLDRMTKAEPFGGTDIKLIGIKEIGPALEPCYQFELVFPPKDEFAAKLQDLYIHTRTGLPVATFVWKGVDLERNGDTLEAMYFYGEIEANVPLSDSPFAIDVDSAIRTGERADEVRAVGSAESEPAG